MSVVNGKLSKLRRHQIVENDDDIIDTGHRDLRDLGRTVGNSYDIETLRELGVVDEHGRLVNDEQQVHVTIFASGIALVDFQLG